MRHGERIQHIYASGEPAPDRHFAHAEKRGAFGKVNGVFFEVHTKPIVSTDRFRAHLGVDVCGGAGRVEGEADGWRFRC